ncbi:MAG: hypothetical protein KZQ96_21020 [Candidatus Thiodiazotropha sp. (ex Lucinoma borealis)]|nr:hypothetical protein [Candidatus Thiodiazotropha sp. (ex Lucinoma borealis)]
MTEHNDDNTAKKPDFIAYNVKDSKDGKGYWNKIGTAWQHRDGQGYDISLDSLPVDGRVTLRELREERMQSYDEQRQGQGPEQSDEHQQTRGRSRGRSRS